MAVPKSRKSKSKKRMRQSINMKLNLPTLTKCPSCGLLTRPHRACTHCGYYKDIAITKSTIG